MGWRGVEIFRLMGLTKVTLSYVFTIIDMITGFGVVSIASLIRFSLCLDTKFLT